MVYKEIYIDFVIGQLDNHATKAVEKLYCVWWDCTQLFHVISVISWVSIAGVQSY